MDQTNRIRLKKEITQNLEDVITDLDSYLADFKINGGGTRGHAIGSMSANIKENLKFFKEYC